MSDKQRRLIINVVGFGCGLLWVAWDEIRNPRIFKIPSAESFPVEELNDWNATNGPKGRWAVEGDELEKMKNWGKVEKIKETSKTW